MAVISALTFTKTDTTIVAVWTTDVSSDSNLTAGGKAAIDNGVAASGTSHQCVVTGLSPSTVYSCIVTSGGTPSAAQNVTTKPAQARILVSSVSSFGTPVKTAFAGDTYSTFLSNDNKTYIMQDDGSGFQVVPNSFYNVQVGVLNNES